MSFNSAVTFFVGENGSGKSTLLEATTRKCGIVMWQGIIRPRYKASPISTFRPLKLHIINPNLMADFGFNRLFPESSLFIHLDIFTPIALGNIPLEAF